MFYKKLFFSILIGSLTGLSLSAMDMDRVNQLAQMYKSGNVQQVVKVETLKVEVAPIVIEEVKVKIPKEIPIAVVEVETSTPKVVASITEESLGLRKTNLYTESDTTGDATTYGKDAAGSSKKIARAFENAPPMIPHDIEGMLPIKIGNNACTGCHEPEVAKSMGATPIPPSHFASFRPTTAMGSDGRITKEGKGVDNTSDFKTVVHALDKLSHARFNCSQCHAPQSTQNPLVANTFTPDFSENGSKKSNLIDVINEGVQ